jgi:hypothetical protein
MTFIDSFSSGLDELPLRKQRSTRCVLQHLEQHGRFSVFEVTDNDTIATTVDRIIRREYIETDISAGYPWTKTKLTDAGKAYLAG